MSISIIFIGLAVLGAFWIIFMYNSLVRLVHRTKEAWADIEVQLKRRHDLIPNVIETVKGYATHERNVLENVTKARTDAVSAKSAEEHARAENMLSNTLKTLFAVSENYPDLKANANFLDLQRELADTENKIQAARRFYNSNVRDLNIAIDTFPQAIIASSFGFTKMEFFELEDAEEAAVREPTTVSFSSE